MFKKALTTLFFISSLTPIHSYATGFTMFPSLLVTAPTQLISGGNTGFEDLGGCDGNLSLLLFATILCTVRDVAEVKMNAENVVFGAAISDAEKIRLGNFIEEIKKNVPSARDLSDEEIIVELANSQLISK